MDLKKQIEDLDAQVTKLESEIGSLDSDAAGDLTEKLEKTQKELENTRKELDKTQAELESLKVQRKKESELDEDEKEMLDNMEDEEEKKKFLAMDKSARRRKIDDMKKNDETVVLDGETIRKSVVGDVSFRLFKRQAERMAAIEKQAAENAEKALNAELRKRVESDFDKLPGDADAKISLLKSISKLPDDQQKTFNEIVKAGNSAMKSAFDRLGVGGGQLEKSAETFNKRVAEIQASERVTRTEAMKRARKRFPQEYEAYSRSGN